MLPNRTAAACCAQLVRPTTLLQRGRRLTLALGLALFCLPAAPGYGSLVVDYDFRADGTSGMVDPDDDSIWEFTIEGLSTGGVTFDAVVTVEADSPFDSTIHRTSRGLGTGVFNGMQFTESLSVSIGVENVTGGIVSSAAFVSAALNNDGASGQTASFSDSGNFHSQGMTDNEIANISFAVPHPGFVVAGSSFEVPGFSLQGVSVQFTTTPEPASLAMMATALLLFGGVAYRRRLAAAAAAQTSPAEVLAA